LGSLYSIRTHLPIENLFLVHKASPLGYTPFLTSNKMLPLILSNGRLLCSLSRFSSPPTPASPSRRKIGLPSGLVFFCRTGPLLPLWFSGSCFPLGRRGVRRIRQSCGLFFFSVTQGGKSKYLSLFSLWPCLCPSEGVRAILGTWLAFLPFFSVRCTFSSGPLFCQSFPTVSASPPPPNQSAGA